MADKLIDEIIKLIEKYIKEAKEQEANANNVVSREYINGYIDSLNRIRNTLYRVKAKSNNDN